MSLLGEYFIIHILKKLSFKINIIIRNITNNFILYQYYI